MKNPRAWVFVCRSCGCRVTQLGGRRRRFCDDCLATIAIRMRRQRQGGQFMRRLTGARRRR